MNSVETKNNYSEPRFNTNESKMSHKELLSKFRMLIKESDINFPMSDELLLCFIRARKYDLHRSLKLLKNYVKMLKKYPDLIMDKHNPGLKQIQLDLINQHFLASPVLEQNGRRIVILNTRGWNFLVCTLDVAFRCILMALQRIITCPENQTRGIVLILDFKDFSLNQVKQFTPAFLKKLADLVQDVFPIRLVGIHVVYEPLVLKILVTMIWPFLSHKIRNRLFFHGKHFEILHQLVDPASLPNDYDGQLGSMYETMFFKNVFPDEKYSNIFDCFNKPSLLVPSS